MTRHGLNISQHDSTNVERVVETVCVEALSQQWFHLISFRTAEEKREMVKHIKEAIKRSIKAGSLAVAPAARSLSFRRNNVDDRLNSSDPGPFLRPNSDPSSIFRRSFSHNPEGTLNRRSSLAESDATHSSVESNADTESISSGTIRERKISLKKKNKAVSPLRIENGLINL